MSKAQTKPERERRHSAEIFERAEKVLVGGVNSPVRAFRSVGGEPLIIERGSEQYLYDAAAMSCSTTFARGARSSSVIRTRRLLKPSRIKPSAARVLG